MQIRINVPDDIGEFLKDNPNIGRIKIQEEFVGMNTSVARGYAAIGRFLHAAPQDGSKASGILEAFKISIDKDTTPGKSAKIKANIYTPESFVDEDSIVQQVIRESGLNNDHWFPVKIKTKYWMTGMKLGPKGDESIEYAKQWSINIDFAFNEKAPLYDSLRQLALEVPPLAAPVKISPSIRHNSKIAAEIQMADVHFGKLACHAETLLGNMDLKIAVKIFNEAIDDLLQMVAKQNPSKIYIPIGHDILHYENLQGVTPNARHILDTDGRLPKVFVEAEKALIRLFDMAAQIAPVEGIWVDDNHSYLAGFALARVLKQRYENSKHVDIDCSIAMMKKYVWGRALIGLVHDVAGTKMKRAVDYFKDVFKPQYGQCRWSEIHAGHTHKKNETKFEPIATIGGTIVRICSALSTIDRWHLMNFFTDAVPAAEAFIIHKDEGVTHNIKKNVDYMKYND